MPLRGPGPFDLCRLADVRDVPGSNDDEVQRLITAVSRTILTAINRPNILPHPVTETRRFGSGGIVLSEWPVTSVQSVAPAGSALRAAPAGSLTAGFTIEPPDAAPPGRPQVLRIGRGAPLGAPEATIAYTAGYQVTAEPAFVPVAAPYTVVPIQAYGAWASDGGAAYVSGGALTLATGTPARGQYAVAPDGSYTFAAADAGSTVALTYGYVPADLANAAVDWIKDRIAYADRIGMQSKSLGGQETVSYKIAATPDFVMAAIRQYAAVVPLC